MSTAVTEKPSGREWEMHPRQLPPQDPQRHGLLAWVGLDFYFKSHLLQFHHFFSNLKLHSHSGSAFAILHNLDILFGFHPGQAEVAFTVIRDPVSATDKAG